jgi:hypothetical protein
MVLVRGPTSTTMARGALGVLATPLGRPLGRFILSRFLTTRLLHHLGGLRVLPNSFVVTGHLLGGVRSRGRGCQTRGDGGGGG